jgi:hypothetical protein
VDSGYPCTKGYLPPYRGEQYHLQQFRSSGDPVGFKELFNYRHSSLRMVIERCFGVLKNLFHILKGMPKYKVFRQLLVVNACCTIHNFIRLVDRDDAFFLYSVTEKVVDNDDDLHDLGFDFQKLSQLRCRILGMKSHRSCRTIYHICRLCFFCLHCVCLV